ncbi:MAG: All-trans-phytoene synthase [Planctomycetota bacterium]
MSTLAADHAVCAAVLERSGSSFALPIRLLPEAKRRGTTALYAFCRRADDLVDDATDSGQARTAVDALGATLVEGLSGARVDDPVIRALVDTSRRFGVPREPLQDILDGVRMDLDRSRYATFAELEEYCRRVASAVGLAAIHVWGHKPGPQVAAAAHACGLAFQLTNILRDVSEDLGRGRMYLPTEDFGQAFTVEDLVQGRIGPAAAGVAAKTAARAAENFRAAAPLDRHLSTDGRMVFRAMYGVYRALFDDVRRAGADVFHRRIRSSRPRLARAAVAAILLGPRPPREARA